MTIILVTGANRGIGFAIVQAAAGKILDATFILGCRSLEAGREAAQKLRDLQPNAAFDVVQINIENDESILAAVKYITEKFGKLDGQLPLCSTNLLEADGLEVLINNAAGVSHPKSQDLQDVRANLNSVFNNAVTSPAMVTRAFLPLLRKSDFPRVIMNSSARGSMERTASRKVRSRRPVQLFHTERDIAPTAKVCGLQHRQGRLEHVDIAAAIARRIERRRRREGMLLGS